MSIAMSTLSDSDVGRDKKREDAIWSRIGWRVMPVILLAYVMSFLDRINVGYAKLTMQQDLQFSDEIYGLGAGVFFLTYLMFEVPSNIWMEKIGARLTFVRIMVLWGLASAATAFVVTPGQFYAVRLLLGAAEAGLFPGIILYLTYWFPSARRGRVTSLFLFGMPLTGVLGGPISGSIIKNMDGLGGMHGWQWMFIVEGIPTALLGLVVYALLIDRPAMASFLSKAEKDLVKQVMDRDTADKGPQEHSRNVIRATLVDRNTWLLAFIYFTCTCAAYTLTSGCRR